MTMEIYLNGMHGLGDNIHQRAIVKHYLNNGHNVTLATPWPQIYWDMPIKFDVPNTKLRAQSKNISLHKNEYIPQKNKIGLEGKIWYSAETIKQNGSFLGAMLYEININDKQPDFSFNVKPEWKQNALNFINKFKKNDKPILFYRPLIERTEWIGCNNRNPDSNAYVELINYIKDNFYIISIADTAPNVEWISGGDINADLKLHKGELDFEKLVGIMSISSLAFVSPGFGLVLAQSLGIPNICVYGGRENSKMYQPGTLISKSLGIDTVNPCSCFNHNHNCEKKINIPDAKSKIDIFLKDILKDQYKERIILEKVKIEKAKLDLSCIPEQHRKRFFNPGELETLATLLRNCKNIAEFGCQNGRTAKVLISNIKTIEKYYGVDVPPDYKTVCEVQRNEIPKLAGELSLDEDKFTLLLHKIGSRGIIESLGELDAVFIDGDHSYEGVIHDHNLAKSKIKNGIIIHHDYHDLGTVGVKEALHFLSKDNKFYHIENTWFCYQIIGNFKI